MPTPTYDLIASTTLASAASDVGFFGIPNTYRDLRIVTFAPSGASTAWTIIARASSDAGSNYSYVQMAGSGSSATSGSGTVSYFFAGTKGVSTSTVGILDIFDYAQTDKHKTAISRRNNAGAQVASEAMRWASTSAITSIVLSISVGGSEVLEAGTTISLYGIAG